MTTEPTVVLTIRVPHELRHELASIARQYDRSVSEAAAWLLDYGISAHYLALGGGRASQPPPKRSRSPQDPEVRRARASKGGTAGGRGRGKKSTAASQPDP